MGVIEIRTFLVSCDCCPVVHGVVQSANSPGLPEGWSRVKVHDCGSTGYTRTDVLCWLCGEREARKAVTSS